MGDDWTGLGFSEDEPIWRYMDFARFVCLLSSGLFFARGTVFDDPWEGAWTKAAFEKFRRDNDGLDASALNGSWADHCQRKHERLASVGVSCWHANEQESDALWSYYVQRGLGVAVRSSVRQINNTLGSDRKFIWRKIDYRVDESSELARNPIDLLSRKRAEFAHERELRLFIEFNDDEISAMKSEQWYEEERKKNHVSSSAITTLARVGPAYATFDETLPLRATAAGVFVKADCSSLVEGVVVAPKTPAYVRRAILDVSRALQLPKHLINRSEMDRRPFELVEFHDVRTNKRIRP